MRRCWAATAPEEGPPCACFRTVHIVAIWLRRSGWSGVVMVAGCVSWVALPWRPLVTWRLVGAGGPGRLQEDIWAAPPSCLVAWTLDNNEDAVEGFRG